MPQTTPEQQRAAAEAARLEGDKNPKADPKEEIKALEEQIAELKKKQDELNKPAVSEATGTGPAKPFTEENPKPPVVPISKLVPQTGTGAAPNVPSITTSP